MCAHVCLCVSVCVSVCMLCVMSVCVYSHKLWREGWHIHEVKWQTQEMNCCCS